MSAALALSYRFTPPGIAHPTFSHSSQPRDPHPPTIQTWTIAAVICSTGIQESSLQSACKLMHWAHHQETWKNNNSLHTHPSHTHTPTMSGRFTLGEWCDVCGAPFTLRGMLSTPDNCLQPSAQSYESDELFLCHATLQVHPCDMHFMLSFINMRQPVGASWSKGLCVFHGSFWERSIVSCNFQGWEMSCQVTLRDWPWVG